MFAVKQVIGALLAVILLCSGCATSPEAENKRQQIDADIEAVLTEAASVAELGPPKRCLADREYDNFRVLDDRHILFKHRRGEYWINTLRTRCPDLRYAFTLRVESLSWSRICDTDKFLVSDWFGWPWYRRWPWRWGGSWGTGVPCHLGKFQAVTEEQVAEIDALLESR